MRLRYTKDNTRLVLNVAFNYGGRDEIVCAIQHMIEDGVQPEEVTDEMVNQLPVHRRSARPGPDHPHLRRAARQQFPDLAGCVLGVVFHPNLLA